MQTPDSINKGNETVRTVPPSVEAEQPMGFWERMSKGLGVLKQPPQEVIDGVDTLGLDTSAVAKAQKTSDVFALLKVLEERVDHVEKTIEKIKGNEFQVKVPETWNEKNTKGETAYRKELVTGRLRDLIARGYTKDEAHKMIQDEERTLDADKAKRFNAKDLDFLKKPPEQGN